MIEIVIRDDMYNEPVLSSVIQAVESSVSNYSNHTAQSRCRSRQTAEDGYLNVRVRSLHLHLHYCN